MNKALVLILFFTACVEKKQTEQDIIEETEDIEGPEQGVEEDPCESEGNSLFYLAENRVTVMCPDALVGDQCVLNGVLYTKRDRDELDILISNKDQFAIEASCTSGIIDMNRLFENSSFLGDISTWDVSSVTNMNSMFSGMRTFDNDLYSWNVSNVEDMGSMFSNAYLFNGNISTWDVSGVEDMRSMFSGAYSFNGYIGSWDVSGVTNMEFMFEDASRFNHNLSGWCVTNHSTEPEGFSENASSWDLPKPVWGTCP